MGATRHTRRCISHCGGGCYCYCCASPKPKSPSSPCLHSTHQRPGRRQTSTPWNPNLAPTLTLRPEFMPRLHTRHNPRTPYRCERPWATDVTAFACTCTCTCACTCTCCSLSHAHAHVHVVTGANDPGRQGACPHGIRRSADGRGAHVLTAGRRLVRRCSLLLSPTWSQAPLVRHPLSPPLWPRSIGGGTGARASGPPT